MPITHQYLAVNRVPTSDGARFFVGGQEPLIALRGLNSLISLFNQRKAGNILPILAPALPSALSFFSAATVIQNRRALALAEGGKSRSIVVTKRVPASAGARFLLGGGVLLVGVRFVPG